MPDQVHSLGGWPFALIFLTQLASHGISLWHTGRYFDGWWLDSYYHAKRHDKLWRLFRDVGYPLCFLWFRFLGCFPQPREAGKWLVFGANYLTHVLIYLVLNVTGWTTPGTALLVVLLMVAFPLFHMQAELSVGHYQMARLFYALSIYCYAMAHTAGLGWTVGGKVTALLLLPFAFQLPSLLLFHFPIAGLLIWTQIPTEFRGWNTEYLWHGFYISAPCWFYLLQSKLVPPQGIYAGYRSIKLSHSFFPKIQECARAYLLKTMQTVASKLNSKNALWLVFGSLVAGWLMTHWMQEPALSASKSGHLLLAGLVMLGAGLLPYILVNCGFLPYGYEAKNGILVDLPMALISVGLAGFLPWPWLQVAVLLLLLSLYVRTCWDYHLTLLGEMCTMESIVKVVSRDPKVKQSGLVLTRFLTEHPGLAKETEAVCLPSVISTHLLYFAFHEWRRIGVEHHPHYKNLDATPENLAQVARQVGVALSLEGQNVSPQKCLLTVQLRPPHRCSHDVGLAAWRKLFPRPQANFEKFLLTLIKSESSLL